MRARSLSALFLLSLSVSCAPAGASMESSSPIHASASSAPSPVASNAPPPTESPKEIALQKRLSTALAYVSEIRNLAAKSAVKGRLIAKDEIERYLNEQIDEGSPPDMVKATEAMLYGFGTVDPGFDYRQSVLELMTSQLLGFYDPKQKTFFVEGSLSGEEADVTLFHELVHALQDQHYDLSHLSDFEADAGDRQSAVHALAEGDATSVMLDAMLKPRGSTALDVPDELFQAQTMLGSAAASAPPVLVRSLLAPYVDGLAFTNQLRRRGGFAAVDEAWRGLPASTEQLLHLDKFLAHEQALVVPLPSAPSHLPDMGERFHDVMGEQTLRLFFEEWLPARTAASAAADWGGDRLSAFSDDARERWAIAWHLRFDSAQAAERAFVAFARSAPVTERLPKRPLADGADVAKNYRDKMCRTRHSQGPLAVVRRGSDVAVTVGPFVTKGAPVTSDSE
ncbi:MAG TPA: hypothetical protein VEQ58_00210, partial [Polyangiaceae bacterium]|nr:hypothetical protein [Polyangiaceae bacterium]